MREKAVKELLRVTRTARGFVQKTSLAFAGFVYGVLMLTGAPAALYAFSEGSYFVGSRVLGILGIVLGVSATLVRIDALDRRSLDSGEDVDVASDGGYLESGSFREHVYQEYVLEPRFRHIMYALYAVGVVFMAISFTPIVDFPGF